MGLWRPCPLSGLPPQLQGCLKADVCCSWHGHGVFIKLHVSVDGMRGRVEIKDSLWKMNRVLSRNPALQASTNQPSTWPAGHKNLSDNAPSGRDPNTWAKMSGQALDAHAFLLLHRP